MAALYKIKEDNSPDKVYDNPDEKPDPSKYTIAKFLLNMLYGRFGMSPEMSSTIILTHDEGEKYYTDYDVSDVTDFNNGLEMIEFANKKLLDNDDIGT